MSGVPTFPKFEVLGVKISAVSPARVSAAVHEWSADSEARCIFFRDVHGVMQAQKDPEFLHFHDQAAVVAPDGMPLAWLGKQAGYDVDRTSGPDFMYRLLGESAVTGLKHYFYGGKPEVVDKLKAAFEAKFPGLSVVGTGTPPFRPLTPDELNELSRDIAASGADVVWIGISTPKQEYLMRDLEKVTSATLMGVGAAFDFHTGEVKRAPVWVQNAGFEWLWRLLSEPRRLWRRYLLMAPKFMVEVCLNPVRKRSLSLQK